MSKSKLIIPLLSALLVLPAQQVVADQALAQSKNCLACHNMDVKVVGPALKDIAAKYKGDAAAVATLAAKVKNGGGGVWGAIPMPPNATTSEAEAEILVKWILSL